MTASPTIDTNADAGDGAAARKLSIMLAPNLDLAEAAELRSNLIRLADRGDVVLDASSVERMSTPCVQVLLAAARSLGAHRDFRIVNPSEIFRSAVAELGLQTEFSGWMD